MTYSCLKNVKHFTNLLFIYRNPELSTMANNYWTLFLAHPVYIYIYIYISSLTEAVRHDWMYTHTHTHTVTTIHCIYLSQTHLNKNKTRHMLWTVPQQSSHVIHTQTDRFIRINTIYWCTISGLAFISIQFIIKITLNNATTQFHCYKNHR